MWEDEPGCWMFKQGNFVVSEDFMPSDVVQNVDERIGAVSSGGNVAISAVNDLTGHPLRRDGFPQSRDGRVGLLRPPLDELSQALFQ